MVYPMWIEVKGRLEEITERSPGQNISREIKNTRRSF